MEIAIIAAVAENDVIGKDNALPWSLPEDLKRFKELTTGHAVVMGRKTYESIGKALPGRLNLVLSRTVPAIDGVEMAVSIDDALNTARSKGCKKTFFIGGNAVYKEALDKSDVMYLTYVKENPEGDAYFPKFNKNDWYKHVVANHPDFVFVNYYSKEAVETVVPMLRHVENENVSQQTAATLQQLHQEVEDGKRKPDDIQEIHRANGTLDKGYLFNNWLVGQYVPRGELEPIWVFYEKWYYNKLTGWLLQYEQGEEASRKLSVDRLVDL